jgi:hypothetical protein
MRPSFCLRSSSLSRGIQTINKKINKKISCLVIKCDDGNYRENIKEELGGATKKMGNDTCNAFPACVDHGGMFTGFAVSLEKFRQHLNIHWGEG